MPAKPVLTEPEILALRKKAFARLLINPGPPKRDKKKPLTYAFVKRTIQWWYQVIKLGSGWSSLNHDDMKDLIVRTMMDFRLYGDDKTVESHAWYKPLQINFASHGGLKSAEAKAAGTPVKRAKREVKRSTSKSETKDSSSEPPKKVAGESTSPAPAKKRGSRRKSAQTDPLQNTFELNT